MRAPRKNVKDPIEVLWEIRRLVTLALEEVEDEWANELLCQTVTALENQISKLPAIGPAGLLVQLHLLEERIAGAIDDQCANRLIRQMSKSLQGKQSSQKMILAA